MKTNKIIAGMTLTGVLLSLSWASAFADESKNKISDKRQMMEKNSMMKISNKTSVKKYMWEGQQIWGDMNKQYLSTLDEDTQEKVLELMEDFKEKNQELKDEYIEDFEEIKSDYKEDYAELELELSQEEDEEDKEEIREEIKTLKDQFETALIQVKEELNIKKDEIFKEYKEDLEKILWDNSDYIEEIEEAKEKRQEMQEKIEEKKAEMDEKRQEMKEKILEAKESRKEFREASKQKISNYKKAYAVKIEDKLAKIPHNKLQQFNSQLEGLFTKVESSETMSDENKEMMLSRITALQDLVTDVLDENELDLNELLEMEL